MSAVEWIAKRRELLDAASEGPWFQDADDPGLVWGEQRSDGDGHWSLFASETGHDAAAQPSDAALIADARTSLPRALDALEAALDRARRIVDEHGDRVYQDNAFAVGAHAAAVAILDDLSAALGADA